MKMQTFSMDGNVHQGYLALPSGGLGNAVLVLHAWWGLNAIFKATCDRLAARGYVAFAPDLHRGKIATTIDEANHILETRDFPLAQATAEAALQYLQAHPSVRGNQLGALGFSMGAQFALLLDELHPGSFAGIVSFYGPCYADLSHSQARIQCHFAEKDEWEPLEQVQKIKAPHAEVHIYPDTAHWFFEEDRPEYDPAAADLAWQRTLEFFNRTLLK